MTTTDTNGAPNLFARAVCFSVTFHRLGTSRKLADAQYAVAGADQRYTRASKMLLKSPEVDAIATRDNAFKAFLRDTAVATPFLRKGAYLIPFASIDRVDAEYQQFLDERKALVSQLMSAYPRLIEADRLRHGEAVFNPLDYPPAEAVRDCYSVEAEYISFAVPGELERLNPDLFARMREQAEARLTSAAADVERVLCESFAKLVEHAVERLTGADSDGKPKVFRDSLLDNIEQFLATFANRNLTDSRELDSLVQQARDLLAGVDPKQLRKDPAVRQRVTEGFEKVQQGLGAMLVLRPSRIIELPDDEPAA